MSAEAISMDPDSEEVEVTISALKANPTKYTRMANEGYRVYVTNHGDRISALVPPETADRIADAEDAFWARRAREAEESGTMSWQQAIGELEGPLG